MSEQIREQVSAFLDGELPNSETELLLKRLTRDGELRESFWPLRLDRRGGSRHDPRRPHNPGVHRTRQSRHRRRIDSGQRACPARPRTRWWRPFAGAAVAAGVAAVAVVALQQRAVAPTLRPGVPLTAQTAVPAQGALRAASGAVPAPREAISYTVPATSPAAPAATFLLA